MSENCVLIYDSRDRIITKTFPKDHAFATHPDDPGVFVVVRQPEPDSDPEIVFIVSRPCFISWEKANA